MQFEAMKEISESLMLEFNDVYCGYLRQPIRAIEGYRRQDNKINYIIGGTCSLYNTYCLRNIIFGTRPGECERYKKYFGR